jgi:phosphorylcholine metabolism protein LicD
VGSIPAILVMLFSPRSSYYPKVRKFKKWKRRKQTINFRVHPLTNTTIHSSKVFNQSTLSHRLSNQRFTDNLGVMN